MSELFFSIILRILPEYDSFSVKPIQKLYYTLLLPLELTAAMLYFLVSLKKTIGPLQLLQNSAPRVLTPTRKRAHITPVLKSLH